MFHYLFTNDLRTKFLEEKIKEAAKCSINGTIKNQSKSIQNNMNTLAFYFNLKENTNCAYEAANGNVRKVIINFIKKFQFPNLRTQESFNLARKDGITLAPMRVILKLLYISYNNENEDSYLTKDEIENFIFFNNDVAKVIKPNLNTVYEEIKKFRKYRILPKSIVNEKEREWKQSDRQIREMINVLVSSGYLIEIEKEKYKLDLKRLSLREKGELLDIILNNDFWSGENYESYQKYMDIDTKKYNLKFSRNRIIFGAPGTGKSYRINNDIEINNLNELYRRITFHPNYTFSQFVGSYKPVGKEDGVINYEFIGGPFLRTLIESLRDEKRGIPHILIIEEINRANPAAVFGDIFQLLDRNSEGESTYTINMSSEMKKYVNKELGNNKDELYIPNNMYIWATMNSADQGVYPMDSAFKRRWSFEYIDIDENEEKLKELGCEIIELPTEMLDSEGNRIYKKYEWNEVRKTINENLKENKINEDKLLGPFFLSEKELKESRENFDNIFKSKVLMYLYEDILKHKNIQFFKEDDERKVNTLCDIMRNYDLGKIFTFELNEYKESEEVMENKGDEIKEPIGV
ncbi:McrB family protein [Clostridium perfringens]|uniref:McrB family protein n=1 Tax=Clostridium perfringens TaxID=1502 RepID=UPI001A1D59E9|nr:AAA family ATPase [Clostridium perfringens]HAT4107009.1 AAA domain-containing protein [Clostridium perfringens]HAT4358089.1 AAA domain-containing protein [Clostridium perfringens]